VRELVAEVLLRLARVAAAAILGVLLYLVATTWLGEPGSFGLALLAFVAAGVVVLLLESSPL